MFGIDDALIIIVGGLLLATCWDDIINWLKKVIDATVELIGNVAHETKIFARRLSNGMIKFTTETMKYIKDKKTGKFKTKKLEEEEESYSEIDEEKVPAHIRALLNKNEKTDVTEEMVHVLKMSK